MADTSKLRLVRCPKCENLLHELPDYSIYQCGGCDTILRAKLGHLDRDFGSGRFDEKRVGVVSDKSENFFESENADVKVSDGNGGSETITARFGNGLAKCVVEGEISRRNRVGNGNLNPKIDKLEDSQNESSNGLSRSGRFLDCKLSDRGMEDQLWRTRRDHFERGRSSSSAYQFNEDTSSYRNQACRSTGAEYVDHDRDELLRKLDELKDQVIRFQNVNSKVHEKNPVEPKPIDPDGYFRDHPSTFHRTPSQLSASNHVARPSYFEQYHDPVPITNEHGSNAPRFEYPYEPRMFTRPQPQRVLSNRHYMSLEPDPFEPHPYSVTLNQPSCACYQCYARQQEVPRQVPPSSFRDRRFSQIGNKSLKCHREVHNASASHVYNVSEDNHPPTGFCEPKSHTRKPRNLNVEVGDFPHARPQRVFQAKEHLCRAIAGGAPFITCHYCFKLLRIPEKVFQFYNKVQWKMSCGACTSVISFAIVDERIVSLDASARDSTNDDLDSSNEFGNGHKRDNASFCSEDYANSVYDYQAMDRQRVSSSTFQDISTSKSEETHNNFSVSATTTEDEHFSDDLAARQGVNPITEPDGKADFSPPRPGSPPQDTFDYTARYRAVNRGGKGSLSNRSNQEQVMTNKSTQRHTSLKESLATEMEIPLDDYADPEESQDSVDREDDQQKGKRGVDSFLAGIIKKSFKDLSRSNQTIGSGKRNVTVNGHMIPDRLVKKAEKLAGPICPGKYWYDNRAGFWGVVGGPCLGIIPPNIQEFNYPMPEECAGGNTGIFVNGRELHRKDLDLLVSRGLPAARDRSYILELSGRVLDKDSGKELVNLGKLAPTVEKWRCGFGMRAPPEAAS